MFWVMKQSISGKWITHFYDWYVQDNEHNENWSTSVMRHGLGGSTEGHVVIGEKYGILQLWKGYVNKFMNLKNWINFFFYGRGGGSAPTENTDLLEKHQKVVFSNAYHI